MTDSETKLSNTVMIAGYAFNCTPVVTGVPWYTQSHSMQEFLRSVGVLTEACHIAKWNKVYVRATDQAVGDVIYQIDLLDVPFEIDHLPDGYVEVGYYADGMRDFFVRTVGTALSIIREGYTPFLDEDCIFGCSNVSELRNCLCDIISFPHVISDGCPALGKVVMGMLIRAEQHMNTLAEDSDSEQLRVERGLIRAFAWNIIESGVDYSPLSLSGMFKPLNIRKLTERHMEPANTESDEPPPTKRR